MLWKMGGLYFEESVYARYQYLLFHHAGEATVTIKRYLTERGTPIGANDAAIAGNAIAASCVLVTNNRREFDRVPDLHVEDWSA